MAILRHNPAIISPALEQALDSDAWSLAVIEDFNNLINEIKDGRIIFKRISQEDNSHARGISEAHAAASILLRADYGAEPDEHGDPQAKFEKDAREGLKQERKIEAWAKATDLWLNDYTDADGVKAETLEKLLESQWTFFNIGSEAIVYSYDEDTVLKAISLSHSNDNVAKALDRIALFNSLFPYSSLSVVGFGRDSLGHFRIIATQPFVQGRELTNEETSEFYRLYGIEEREDWLETTDGIIKITDLSNTNILLGTDNHFYVIDADLKYNTPEEGGSVRFENSLTPKS